MITLGELHALKLKFDADMDTLSIKEYCKILYCVVFYLCPCPKYCLVEFQKMTSHLMRTSAPITNSLQVAGNRKCNVDMNISQSKYLNGQLGPPMSKVTFFGSLRWAPRE